MIKSLLRKLTGRELPQTLNDANQRLHAGDRTFRLPYEYSFYNGVMSRNVRSEGYTTTYEYDADGLLQRKITAPGFLDSEIITNYEPHGSFTGKKQGARFNTLQRWGIAASIASIITGAAMLRGAIPPKTEWRTWQEFTGTSNQYAISIDLSCYGDACRNITQLESTSGNRPLGISGHDYDLDGTWDRIFIRKKASDGYSSVAFQNGVVSWEPCASDEQAGLPRFTPQEIENARTELDKAQSQITDRNRIVNWSSTVELE